jgi:DNA processing protein
MDNLLKYQIALTMLPGVGGVTAKRLISYCGGVEALFHQKKSSLMKIPGIGSFTAESITSFRDFDRAEKEMEFIAKTGIKTLFYLDKEYPSRLKHCEDGPILLFYKGNADLNKTKVVSVVGTRNITEYGKQKCDEIIEGLKKYSPLIVSGLAYGVDTRAHKASLDNHLQTVAVLGHGLDRIYPPLNKNLAERILDENGGLLSDFVSGTKPDRENFPSRNRIIAGLADVLIVVEAAISGGALITAHIASSYDRDVIAIPGRTTDIFSQGCNRLIKTNKAALAENIADIEYIMGWEPERAGNKKIQHSLFVELDDEEQMVVDVISQQGEASFDLIIHQSGIAFSKASSLLLNLEFKGIIKPLPGRMFKLMKG